MNINSILAVALSALTLASTTSVGATVTQVSPCVSIVRPLLFGSHGNDVAQLQVSLGLKPTGYFGHLTQDALGRWQISNGIIQSKKSIGAGILGPRSRLLLSCKPMPLIDQEKKVLPKMQPLIPTSTAPIVSPPSASPVPAIVPVTKPAGGGGGRSPAPSNACPPFTTPRPTLQCTTATWVIIDDEAGCPAQWDCTDPSAIE